MASTDAMPNEPYYLGYIVCNGQHRAMELGNYHDGPKTGLLLSGGNATLFTTYGRALDAIKRTERYAKRHNYRWFVDGPYYTIRLTRALDSYKP